MNKSPGKFIHQKRDKADLSLDYVAKALGYGSRQTILDIENDKFRLPVQKVSSLAETLGINPKELLLICYPEIKDILEA